jgi:hypothetical protein
MSLKFSERFPVFDVDNMPDGWLEKFLRGEARSILNDRGALLIRNTPIGTTQELEHCARLLIKAPAEAYTGGVVPRTAHSRYVFSSTEISPLFKMKLHNEMAYQENYPRYISFFCATPPPVLGETFVAHQEEVQQNLPAPLQNTIINDDVVYVRRYLSREYRAAKINRFKSIFVAWQDAFKTDDKSRVEMHCRNMNVSFDWGPEDTLTLRTVLPSTRIHPDTGQRVYFNQVLSHNFSFEALGPFGFVSHRLAGIKRDSAPRDTYLASYGTLSRRDGSALKSAYSKSARVFRWRKHDWMIVDNLQVLHSRNRFLGKRAIWVVMGD